MKFKITCEAHSPVAAKGAAGAAAAAAGAGAAGAPSSAQLSVTAGLVSTSFPQPSEAIGSAAVNSFGAGPVTSLAACSSFSAYILHYQVIKN